LLFQSDAGQLELAGPVTYIGALTGGRTYTFTGTGNHLVSGVISSAANGAPIGVAMNGTGRLILSAVNTYTNTTTVTSGTLLVNGSINSSAGVSVTGGTLGGIGAINDTVSIGASGTLAPGAQAIGTITISSNLTLAGTTYIEVSKTGNTNDNIVGLPNVNYGGTLFATNLAGTLNIGDSFTVFNTAAHTGNFASITGTPGAGKAWSFNPNTGVLSVVVGVNSTPTNIVTSVSGNTLTLSWPADHIGWRLQVQTNSLGIGLKPATNAWFDVAGSTSVNSVNVTFNPANGTVFYRMVYP
jgi:autotransporter-associated beta strand protein